MCHLRCFCYFRYATSKCHTVKDLENLRFFGYRGEALASIVDVSGIVEIQSRPRVSSDTYTKTFKHGEALKVGHSKSHRPCAGMTITIHDIFYNLPVRRKSMNEALELERICHRLESIAIVYPSISFSLRNDNIGSVLLQTHKSNSMLGAFTHLFGGSKASVMSEVSQEYRQFQLHGYIGKEGHHNKTLQFIYLNNRLVLKTKLHKLVNYLISKSLINPRRRTGPNTPGSPRKISTDPNVTSSPSKLPDRHGMYILGITCPLTEYDITFDPAKTLVEFQDWAGVLNCVEMGVVHFIRKENLTMKLDMSEKRGGEEEVSESGDGSHVGETSTQYPQNDQR